MIDWIGFDADDTLWKNEEYYLEGRDRFLQVLRKYGLDEGHLERFDHFEVDNIGYYGYGVMSFVLSMIEIGIELTEGALQPGDIQELIRLAKDMLSEPVEVYPGVEDQLRELSGKFPLLLITKGDLYHQQRKYRDSGLREYFSAFEVVSRKNPGAYREVLGKYHIKPDRFLMVGNSLRSDILPVLELGAYAVHLAGHPTWSYEDDPTRVIQSDRFFEVEEITQVGERLTEAGLIPGG